MSIHCSDQCQSIDQCLLFTLAVTWWIGGPWSCMYIDRDGLICPIPWAILSLKCWPKCPEPDFGTSYAPRQYYLLKGWPKCPEWEKNLKCCAKYYSKLRMQYTVNWMMLGILIQNISPFTADLTRAMCHEMFTKFHNFPKTFSMTVSQISMTYIWNTLIPNFSPNSMTFPEIPGLFHDRGNPAIQYRCTE